MKKTVTESKNSETQESSIPIVSVNSPQTSSLISKTCSSQDISISSSHSNSNSNSNSRERSERLSVTVIGLGYVGMPLALLIDSKGHDVIGVDPKEIRFEKKTAYTYTQKKIEFSTDVYIVCVPTPVNNNKDPDFSYVESVCRDIAGVLKPGQLVIIESTVNPGTCENIVKPILDQAGVKGYHLAHCPERINPGDPKWSVSNIPRVVGGVDLESCKAAYEFYSSIIDAEIVQVSGLKEAEATKILENTFRDVNIAFINEMAQSFSVLGIDTMEVIKGASSKPFGFMPHYPGVGVGGHCIAVDPYYMIQKGKEVGFDHTFLMQARKINSGMPKYVAGIVQDELNKKCYPLKGTKVVILGVAYKPNVADDRESPTADLVNELLKKGAIVKCYDPHIPFFSSYDSLDEAIKDATCIVIATAHKEFLNEHMYKGVHLLVDGRNCLDEYKIPAGTTYVGVGR